jgi:hypothetical protein
MNEMPRQRRAWRGSWHEERRRVDSASSILD